MHPIQLAYSNVKLCVSLPPQATAIFRFKMLKCSVQTDVHFCTSYFMSSFYITDLLASVFVVLFGFDLPLNVDVMLQQVQPTHSELLLTMLRRCICRETLVVCCYQRRI